MSKRQSYWELLRDPRWQEKRLRIMERDEFKCTNCEDKSTTLNVHHAYYEKGLMPWEYPDQSLHTLCEPCHHHAEELRIELHRQLGFVDPFCIPIITGFVLAWNMQNDERRTAIPTSSLELFGMMKLFQTNDGEWPSIMFAARGLCEDGLPLSAHDFECAVKELELCKEVMRQLDIEKIQNGGQLIHRDFTP